MLSSLIDSAADANLINEELVRQLRNKRVSLSKSAPARALDGHFLGMVTHQTEPGNLFMTGTHYETIQFHILPLPHIPLILVYPLALAPQSPGRLGQLEQAWAGIFLPSSLPQAGSCPAALSTTYQPA